MNRVKIAMAKLRPELKPLFEKAAEDTSALPATAFADALRQYPIHSRDDAVLSKLAALDDGAAAHTVARIDRALDLYGLDPAKVTAYTTKAASQEMAEVHYLLPQQQSIPVPSATHLKEASEALVQSTRHLKVAQVTEAAVNAVKLGGLYDLDSDELPPKLFKYAGLTTCDAGVLLDWVEARSALCPSGSDVQQRFDKLASSLTQNFPPTGMITDRDLLIKIASALETLDELAGIQGRYDRTLLSPLETVFNMDKLSSTGEPMCNIAGKSVPLSKIQALPDDVFDEFVGDGASADKGNAEVCKSMIETLPADVQRSMYANLKSYLT